jgi:hypothetical protein
MDSLCEGFSADRSHNNLVSVLFLVFLNDRFCKAKSQYLIIPLLKGKSLCLPAHKPIYLPPDDLVHRCTKANFTVHSRTKQYIYPQRGLFAVAQRGNPCPLPHKPIVHLWTRWVSLCRFAQKVLPTAGQVGRYCPLLNKVIVHLRTNYGFCLRVHSQECLEGTGDLSHMGLTRHGCGLTPSDDVKLREEWTVSP